MEFLGKRTLSILLMHKFPILVFQIMTPVISGWLKNPDSFQGILSALITAVLSIIMCCIADKVIHRIVPWMLGAFERIKE